MAQDPKRLLAQADKAYSSIGSGSIFAPLIRLFISNTDKYENAAELYVKAAVAYRVRDDGLESGRAYEKAATIQGTINERNDMVNTLIEASKVYRKDYPGDSSRCLSQIVQHFIDEGGNFRRAAKYQDDLAQIYEQQRDSANARQAYALAAQWYEGDNAIITANKLNVKSAEHAALDGDYLDAINRFEHAANQCLLKDTTKFSVPRYLLQAGYCHLAHDIVGAMRALQSYRKMEKDYSLSSSGKELEFLGGLMETVEQGDSKAFEDKRKERSGTYPITSWDETMFDRISNEIKVKEEDFS